MRQSLTFSKEELDMLRSCVTSRLHKVWGTEIKPKRNKQVKTVEKLFDKIANAAFRAIPKKIR